MSDAPGTPETATFNLRDVYDQLPENTSELLRDIEEGDESAQHTLARAAIASQEQMDPWHSVAVLEIIRSNLPLKDREGLIGSTLQSLDTIKSQVGEGVPFLQNGRTTDFEWRRAGVLGKPEEIIDFPKGGVRMRTIGAIARTSPVFPTLDLGRDDSRYVRLYPDYSSRHDPDTFWGYLREIANGTGEVAFGEENIRKNIEHKQRFSFYAALALQAAGLKIGAYIDPDAVLEAREKAIDAIAADIIGIADPAASHVHPESRLQKASKLNMKVLLETAGLDSQDVTGGLTRHFEAITGNSHSSVANHVLARRAQSEVYDTVSAIFSAR